MLAHWNQLGTGGSGALPNGVVADTTTGLSATRTGRGLLVATSTSAGRTAETNFPSRPCSMPPPSSTVSPDGPSRPRPSSPGWSRDRAPPSGTCLPTGSSGSRLVRRQASALCPSRRRPTGPRGSLPWNGSRTRSIRRTRTGGPSSCQDPEQSRCDPWASAVTQAPSSVEDQQPDECGGESQRGPGATPGPFGVRLPSATARWWPGASPTGRRYGASPCSSAPWAG